MPIIQSKQSIRTDPEMRSRMGRAKMEVKTTVVNMFHILKNVKEKTLT